MAEKTSKLVPFVRENAKSKDVLELLYSMVPPFQVIVLSKIYELIKDDIAEYKLASKADITNFTSSVQRREVVGLEHSRHGNYSKDEGKIIKKPLSAEECEKFMLGIIDKWLDICAK